MRNIIMILFIILLIANLYLLLQLGKPVATSNVKEKWIVYGTMDCGWTRKQLEYMRKSRKNFEFIDCTKNDCTGMNGFPTILHPDGKKTAGYTEV
jgi:hypothetical protein